MWRDPLDELIEDLEHMAPDPRSVSGGLFPIEKLQQLTDAILYGSDEEVAALKADPDYQDWVARCQRGTTDWAQKGPQCPASLRSTVQYVRES